MDAFGGRAGDEGRIVAQPCGASRGVEGSLRDFAPERAVSVEEMKRARRALEEATEKGETALVTDIVLCELDWVLDAAYRVPRQRILAALTGLAADRRFRFEDADRVRAALDLYQAGSADLADYLLGLAAEAAGARTTYTFDRDLRSDQRFTQVPR